MDVDTATTNVVLKSNAQQRLEARLGQPLETALRDMYHREGLTQIEIAERLGLDQSTVTRWMRQFGIPVRYGAGRTRRLRIVEAGPQ